MEEERELILRLVAEGKITSTEADALLQALEEDWESDSEAADRVVEEPSGGPEAKRNADATLNPEARLNAEAKRDAEARYSADARRAAEAERPTRPVGPDLSELGSAIEKIMTQLGDELTRIPEQIARLGVRIGHRTGIPVSLSREWSAASGPVRVTGVRGDIAVETWDRDRIDVEGELFVTGPLDEDANRLIAEQGLALEAAGGGLRVHTLEPVQARSRGLRVTGADLRLRVPRGTSVDVSAVRGDVELTGELGAPRVEVISGDVEIRGGSGAVHGSSRSGDITAGGLHADSLRLESASGDLEGSGTVAAAELHTASGDLSLDLTGCRRLKAATASGDVDARLALEPGAECDVTTVSGDIDAVLQVQGGLQVTLESMSGDLDCSLSLDRVEKTRGRLTGSRGDGATRVHLKSISGDVTLR